MDVILIPLLKLSLSFLNFFSWGLFIYLIIGWLVAFNLINRDNRFCVACFSVLSLIFDPILFQIRKVIPMLGTLDISPIVLIVLVSFAKDVIIRIIIKFLQV